jgi:hypothetical protein
VSDEQDKDDLRVLAAVGRMYLDALDADPEHEMLTLPEAFMVTQVREAVERQEVPDGYWIEKFSIEAHMNAPRRQTWPPEPGPFWYCRDARCKHGYDRHGPANDASCVCLDDDCDCYGFL